jgi:hypothetical protein
MLCAHRTRDFTILISGSLISTCLAGRFTRFGGAIGSRGLVQAVLWVHQVRKVRRVHDDPLNPCTPEPAEQDPLNSVEPPEPPEPANQKRRLLILDWRLIADWGGHPIVNQESPINK